MKKLLLNLGIISVVFAPITALVSCSDDSKKTDTNNNDNNNDKVSTTENVKDKITNIIDSLSSDVISTKNHRDFINDISNIIVNDPVDIDYLGLPNNYLKLEDEMTVRCTINTPYNSATHSIKINLKITAPNNVPSNIEFITVSKTVTIKAKYDFSIEKAKFHDLTSSKTASQLTLDVNTIDNITNQELGIMAPSLVDGVTAKYSIENKSFVNGTPKTILVHLNYDDYEDTTKFELMPTYDFDSSISKFHDLISTKTASQLTSSIYEIDNITDQKLGMTTPELPDGVTATYSIDKLSFEQGEYKTIKVTLNHGLEHTTTSFKLRPKLQWALKIGTQNLLDNNGIKVLVSDGHGGFWAAGVGGKLDNIDADGNRINGWITKTLLDGNDIYSMVSDGKHGFFIGGADGKIDHMNSNGNIVNGWSIKTLLNGHTIHSMVPDNHGGVWAAGDNVEIDHMDANGKKLGHTKNLTGHFIYSIISDGKTGFLVGGAFGKFAHIDASGNIIGTTQTLIGGNSIYEMILNKDNTVFVAGRLGKLDHIYTNGHLVEGWTTQSLFGNSNININSIISDEHDGFWVVGDSGRLDHIDVNGHLAEGWSTQILLGGTEIIYSIIANGDGRFLVGGASGRLAIFLY